jgi:GNAT superfamily N-acetyltransferase
MSSDRFNLDELPFDSAFTSAMELRKDGNPNRIRAWNEMMQEAKSRLFDTPFGQHYFQLQVLATHPQYQRLGAGSALCNWGLKMARLENLSVAVFASPMGRKLYSALGFEPVSNVIIQAPGEEEFINIKAMVYKPDA